MNKESYPFNVFSMKINEDDLFEKINEKFYEGNTIIFAPNGTGKSHIIAKKYKKHDDCLVISSFDESILGKTQKNKEFVLFEDKTREMNESIDDLVNEIDCTAIKRNKKNQEGIEKIVKQVCENESIIKELLELKSYDDCDNPIKAFKDFGDNVSKNKSDKLLKELFEKYVEYHNKHVNELKTCPCCDNDKFDQEKVYEKIQGELDENLTDVPSEVIEFYNNHENEREIIRKFEFEDILNEDIEKCKKINALFAEKNELQEKRLNLKNRIEDFEKYLHKFIDVESEIVYEDRDIVLKFPRKITEYSTGEKNLILLILKLMEFECCGKKKLVIDDMISSVDTLYIFEMINLIGEYFRDRNEKKFLMLTHNPDILNIFSCINLNDKDNRKKLIIQYFYLDRISENEFYLSNFKSEPNISNLLMLHEYAVESDNKKDANKYVFALLLREINNALSIQNESYLIDNSTLLKLMRIEEDVTIDNRFFNAIFHDNIELQGNNNAIGNIRSMLDNIFETFNEQMFCDEKIANNLIIDKFIFLASLRKQLCKLCPEERVFRKVIDKIKESLGNTDVDAETLDIIYILLNSSSHAANLNNYLSFAFSISIKELLNLRVTIKNICDKIDGNQL